MSANIRLTQCQHSSQFPTNIRLSSQPTFVVCGPLPAHHPHPTPTPPPGGCGNMESEERPPRSHPSPTSGVEGSPRVSRLTTPTCPTTSPSRGAGRLSLQAETQQLFSPRQPSPSCTAPTWAHVARGGVAASFQPVHSTAADLTSPPLPLADCPNLGKCC